MQLSFIPFCVFVIQMPTHEMFLRDESNGGGQPKEDLYLTVESIHFNKTFLQKYMVIHQVWIWVGLAYILGVPPAGGLLL